MLQSADVFVMPDIDLKHTDQRLIEVLRNINPHRSPYTAALGREAANKITQLQIDYAMDLARDVFIGRERAARWALSKNEHFDGKTVVQMFAEGRGDEVVRHIRRMKYGSDE